MALEAGVNWRAARVRRREYRCSPCHNKIKNNYLKKAGSIAPAVRPRLPAPAPRVSHKVFREDNPQGYVYAITNPAWPDLVKLGMTGDLKKRLAQYQTASPYRDYVLLHWAHTYDKNAAERRIHDMFRGHSHRGEWFYGIPLEELHAAFEEVREFDGREFLRVVVP